MSKREIQDRKNEKYREKYRNDAEFRNMQLSRRANRSGTKRSWDQMRKRVLCMSNDRYENYKGRIIDPRWNEFKNFLADMGERPKGMSIDRKNNNKGYCKGNCQWATPKQQARNRNETKLSIESVREMRNLFDVVPNYLLAEKYHVHPSTISNVKNGYTWAEEVNYA